MAKKKTKAHPVASAVRGFVFGPVRDTWNECFVFKIEDISLWLTELLYWN